MAESNNPNEQANTGASASPAGVSSSKRVEAWQDAIRLGIRYRNQYGRAKRWTTYKQYYRGFFKEGTVPVNIIYSIGRAMIAQTAFRIPRVSVIPTKPGYSMHARVTERIDNMLLRECNVKQELKSMLLDTYICGKAPAILGYDSEYGFNPSFTVEELETDGSLSMFSKKGEKIEYNYNVSPGMPWFLRCNPVDFVVPWGCKRIEEAPWFAFRKMRPLADIKEDPKYKNLDGLGASFYNRLEGTDGDAPKSTKAEDFKMEWAELWQIHDVRTHAVYAITLDHKKFLREEDDELQIEGLPCLDLGFNEDPDYYWWPSDCRLIEQQQLEINDVRTMAKYHRRVALLKVLYDKQMLKSDELSKLFDGDVKSAVAVDAGQSGDIRKAVALFQSHVPPDLAAAAAEIREDIREIIGFSRNQQGSFEAPSGRRSATEASIVNAASMLRIDERRDIVADLLGNVVRKFNQSVYKFWDTERVTDIVGPDGARYWVRFTGKEIRGEYTHKINPEESRPTDQAVMKAEASEFIKLAATIPGMDIRYLVEEFAGRFDWIDAKRLFPGEGAGRSPEKAMFFSDMIRKFPQGAPRGQPALA